MSQNSARRSAHLHTFDAAINFGQIGRDPRDLAEAATMALAQNRSALRPDGLESLFAANDDMLIDFDRLAGTGGHGKAPDDAVADDWAAAPAWMAQAAEHPQEGHPQEERLGHAAQHSTLPGDLIGVAEMAAGDDAQPEAAVTRTQPHPTASHLPAGSSGTEPVIGLADIVTVEDPLNKAFLPPPSTELGGAPKPEIPDPEMHRATERGDAAADTGTLSPFRLPTPDQGLFTEA